VNWLRSVAWPVPCTTTYNPIVPGNSFLRDIRNLQPWLQQSSSCVIATTAKLPRIGFVPHNSPSRPYNLATRFQKHPFASPPRPATARIGFLQKRRPVHNNAQADGRLRAAILDHDVSLRLPPQAEATRIRRPASPDPCTTLHKRKPPLTLCPPHNDIKLQPLSKNWLRSAIFKIHNTGRNAQAHRVAIKLPLPLSLVIEAHRSCRDINRSVS